MCLLFLDKSVSRCVLSKDIIPPVEVTLPTQQVTTLPSFQSPRQGSRSRLCFVLKPVFPPVGLQEILRESILQLDTPVAMERFQTEFLRANC